MSDNPSNILAVLQQARDELANRAACDKPQPVGGLEFFLAGPGVDQLPVPLKAAPLENKQQ
jgi:hypothetical protein